MNPLSRLLASTALAALVCASSAEASSCEFARGEWNQIRRAVALLPHEQQAVAARATWRKNCEAAPRRVDSKGNVLSRKFGFARGRQVTLWQELFDQSEEFVRRIVVHELIHVLDGERRWSRLRSFREVNGWKRKFLFFSAKREAYDQGSYRPYGDESPKEDLATAAEGYFTDPSFACSFPAMTLWFRHHVGESPVRFKKCTLRFPVDPERVSQVSYAMAAPFKERVESRFGHSVLVIRQNGASGANADLVIQAVGQLPGDDSISGLETREELELKEKRMKERQAPGRAKLLIAGATGGMDARFQPHSFAVYFLSSNIAEGRDLTEVPLPIRGADLQLFAQMINLGVQRQWGSYSILSNNCATLVSRLINLGLAERVARPTALGVYTPRATLSSVLDRIDAEPVVHKSYATLLREGGARITDSLNQIVAEPDFRDLDILALRFEKPEQLRATAAAAALDSLRLRIEGLHSLGESPARALGEIGFYFGLIPQLQVQESAQKLVSVLYQKEFL